METIEERDPPAPGISRRRLGGLWQNTDFVKLWVGTTVSLIGSQVTGLALPLTAALTLAATPLQMGLLGAVGMLPWALIGLPAGAWVDRLPRRPILIVADLGRAGLLAAIPLAALAGGLRIELLYAVAFLAGVLTVIFEVAAGAFLPALLARDDLVEGNSKLQASVAVSDIGGPGLAGALVQALTPPLAIVADVVSFLASAACVITIRADAPPAPPRAGRSLRREMAEGLRQVAHDPLLRPLTICGSAANLALAVQLAVRVLYLTRDLGLEPALIGVLVAAGSVGALPATVLTGRLSRRVGAGPTMVGGLALISAGSLLFALAAGDRLTLLLLLVVSQVVSGLGGLAFVIVALSLRQAVTPRPLLGRVIASSRFLSRSALAGGLIAGGLLGEHIGLRATLFVAGGLALATVVLALVSPLRALRVIPLPDE